MNHVRSIGTMVLTAMVLVVGQVLIGPWSVAASAGAPPTVPEDIAVPPPHMLLFSSHAKGVQVYACQNGQWALRAPRAALFDPQTDQLTGIHYGGVDRKLTPGPWWESLYDGSRIRGSKTGEAPSPNANSIPLLRLEVAERYGTGVFTPVSYIQRLNTVGGVGPTGACQANALRQVPYTADYYFYGNP